MNATKQKILKVSLELFNTYGVSNVSLRSIADASGISVGNLQYHFKKREALVEAHYFNLVKKIDAIDFLDNSSLLKSFFNSAITLISILFDYQFFLLDFTTIARGNAKIKAHYAEVSKRREALFLELVQLFIAEDIFRVPVLHNEYLNVFKRIEVLSNFWFSSILIQKETLDKTSISTYSVLVSQSLHPYLTKQGRQQYAALFPSQRSQSAHNMK